MSVSAVFVNQSLCPIVDSVTTPRRYFFSATPSEIWTKPATGTPAPDPIPYALPKDNTKVKLTADVPGAYTVQATMGTEFLLNPIEITFTTPNDQQEVTLTVKNIHGLGIVSGIVQWRMTNTNTNNTTITDVALELYFINPTLPSFLDDDGIPLALLRLDMLQSWKSEVETRWPDFVVKKLFEHPRLTYDSYSGSSMYTSWDTALFNISPVYGVTLNCWLDLFLSDMNGLTQQTVNAYAVNCYDLTALAQTIIALGVDISKSRAKFLRPFGYLKETQLVGGIGPCNNPFYRMRGKSQDVKCDEKDESRSEVTNHMFLATDNTASGLIYDACVGPVLGTWKLTEYLSKAIDKVVPANAPPDATGTLADVYDGPGVTTLSSSVCTVYKPATGYGEGTLLQNIMALSPDLYVVKPPYIGYDPDTGGRGVVATFSLIPIHNTDESKKETIMVHVFRFDDLTDVQEQFLKRREEAQVSLHGGAEQFEESKEEAQVSPNDGADLNGYEWVNNMLTRGGLRMFYDPNKYVLTIISSLYTTTDELKPLAEELKDAVSKVPSGHDAQIVIDDNGINKPDMPVKTPTTFTISLTMKKPVQDKWIGCTAETSFGNAFFATSTAESVTKSIPGTNGGQAITKEFVNVNYSFYARRTRSDNLLLTVCDANLLREEHQSAVYII